MKWNKDHTLKDAILGPRWIVMEINAFNKLHRHNDGQLDEGIMRWLFTGCYMFFIILSLLTGNSSWFVPWGLAVSLCIVTAYLLALLLAWFFHKIEIAFMLKTWIRICPIETTASLQLLYVMFFWLLHVWLFAELILPYPFARPEVFWRWMAIIILGLGWGWYYEWKTEFQKALKNRDSR